MHVVLIHYRYGLKGGLETRLHNYIRWFQEAGHEVTVLYGRRQANSVIPEGVHHRQLSVKGVPHALRPIVFGMKVAKALKGIDHDLSLSLGRTWGQHATLAGANHRGFLKAMGRKGTRLTDWVQDYCDRRSFEESTVIFAASDMMREELVQLYQISPEKVRLLLPPLALDHFSPQLKQHQLELKKKIGMSVEKISCVFFSTSHYRKGLDILLEVFSQLSPERYELWVGGDPVDTELPHVHEMGFVRQPAEIYAAADLYLHPARYEPFGQVISEALRCRTPVFVSSRVGAQQILTSQGGKIIPSLATNAWCEALQEFKAQDYAVSDEFFTPNTLDLDAHMERMLKHIPQS